MLVAGSWAADETTVPGTQAVAPAEAAANAPQPTLRGTGEKRQWLKEQLQQGLQNPWQVRQLQATVDRLNTRQVDALVDAVLAQQLPENRQPQQREQLLQQAALQQYRAQVLQRVLSDRLAWRRFEQVGYLPVITWLPAGTSFGASAVISPDGRYVRTGVNPFFSSVGPVYSYNLNTGETRLLPPQSPYPSYDYRPLGTPPQDVPYRMGQMPSHHLPPPPPSAYPNVWYDGMRTRVGPRP
jgi:hypothetical protein